MSKLPLSIHTAEQVRAIDRFAIESLGIPGYELMSRAGAAAYRVLQEKWPAARRILVICGSGNNAGDGYVVAKLARQAGMDVSVVALTATELLRGDADKAWQDFRSVGGVTVGWSATLVDQADVIVDALFGTGLSRTLDQGLCDIVDCINHCAAPKFALDIPSGLHANTGEVMGCAIKANCTVTFIGLKLGFYVGLGPEFIGELYFDDLNVPKSPSVQSAAERIDVDWLPSVLPRRSRLSHKGSNGHVLIIGGGRGMAGAVRLAGEAALRVGAGLVTVATRGEHVAAVVVDRPELIVRAVEAPEDLAPLIERADVVAIGPGLGQDDWARALFEFAFGCKKPLVVDADALNLLAARPSKRNDWILTPHPGEAGRLLGVDTRDVQANRLQSVMQLAERFGAIAVLKGACTVVMLSKHLPQICDRGNPGMATPGMGDVLTGVIAGLRAQMRSLDEPNWVAARAGVLVHAMAGDSAAGQLGRHVERGLIASDLFPQLPACVNPVANN